MPIAIDPDGDTLTYQWSTDCPTGTFDDDTLSAPTLSFAPVPSCSDLDCLLTVTANGVDGSGDPVNVMCTAPVSNDTIAPEFAAFPGNLAIALGESTDSASTGRASAIDSCGSVPTVSFSDSAGPSMCPQQEIITRTWTASDECDNAVSLQTIPGHDAERVHLKNDGDRCARCPVARFAYRTRTDT